MVFLLRFDVDDLFRNGLVVEAHFARPAELDDAGLQRMNRMILAHISVRTREEVGSALADDDGTRVDRLSVRDLDAEVLRLGITQVSSCTAGLSMCHK